MPVLRVAWASTADHRAWAEGRAAVPFDGGPLGMSMARIAPGLGVDFSTIDAMTLRHRHWDHAAGLLQALAMMPIVRRTPPYLHPSMCAERGLRQSDDGMLPMAPDAEPQDEPGDPHKTGSAVKALVDMGLLKALRDDALLAKAPPRRDLALRRDGGHRGAGGTAAGARAGVPASNGGPGGYCMQS